jgi:uncharacterized protein YcnI
MKKLLLSTAILLGSLSTFAQASTTIAVGQAESNTKIATSVKTEMPSTNTQDSYTEVKLDEVPTDVKVSLLKIFPGSKLEKAYVNDKKEYKLEVKAGKKSNTVFADATGKLIK